MTARTGGAPDGAPDGSLDGSPDGLPGHEPYRIAVVGTGPRGMMVLERLMARLTASEAGSGSTGTSVPTRPVEILAIDGSQVGAGRVYRTDQPEWFLMNTVAGQISAFSGLPDSGPARPGAGPSLCEWWQATDPSGNPGPDGYAPRAAYGRYLQYVMAAIDAAAPAGVHLRRVHDRVAGLVRSGGRYRLTLDGAGIVECDRVVLTTGHSTPDLTGRAAEYASFAARQPGLRYFAGDSAADLPLASVAPGTAVGVIGLGLSCYDVIASFTTGRGGRFVPADASGATGAEGAAGALRYLPGGREPCIVAGSRSGMPLPPRGRNQKPPTYAYDPVVFRPERVRAAAVRRDGRALGTPLSFRADVFPWLLAEMELTHCGLLLELAFGPDVRQRFVDAVADAVGAADLCPASSDPPDVRAMAISFGLDTDDVSPLDLDVLSRPFAGRHYPSPDAFTADLLAETQRQLGRAAEGNVDSPVGAALDVMRDTRWVLRDLVDFGGLTPESHRHEFLDWYVPRTAFLAAGPPAGRVRELVALLEAGVVRVVGPRTEFTTDERAGRFVLRSPDVSGSAVPVDVLVDARIPVPDLRTDSSPLARELRRDGSWTSFVTAHAGCRFDTGGVAVSGSPFHPIDRFGHADRGLYVLGIPTEHTRWFTQVGSSRPGRWSDFVHDADDIAGSALAPVTHRSGAESGTVAATLT